MYKSFYNLDSRPFETHHDPSFLWLGEKHKEALTLLRCALRENKGFLLLTGDAGVGKTTLINALTETVGRDVAWAVIGDPSLARLDFYNAVARGFKIDKECTSKVQFLLQFSNFLHKAHDENKKVLLLVDDCHLLSQEMLEELRLLSNIEKEEVKLINIFFVGRPEFNAMLVQPKNRAVGQRLTLAVELAALTLNETDDYIRHRLDIAGADDTMFTAKAIQIIHRCAGGIPRLINTICDHAMVAGSVQGKPALDHQLLAGCLQRLNLPVKPGSNDGDRPAGESSHPQHFRGRFSADSSVAAGSIWGFNRAGDRHRGWVKYVAGVALVTVTGAYFYFPAAPPRDTVRGESETVVQQPAKKELIQAVASPAVAQSGTPEAARAEERTGQVPAVRAETPTPAPAEGAGIASARQPSDTAAQESPPESKPAPIDEPSAGEIKAGRFAPLEPNRVVLRLRPDSQELTGEAAREFRRFVEKLRDYPRAKLLVKGFVSAKTNSPENVKLSEERAMGVQKLLVKSGIEPARIDVKGLGNQEAVAANDTRGGRAKNRRVEVIVVGDER